MKKEHLIWVFVLILLVPNSFSYTDCTPDVCPAETLEGNLICDGSECVRECFISRCSQDWSLVRSETIGFDDNRVEEDAESGVYTPTDQTKCYNFTWQGPASNSDIDMGVNDNPSIGDCDSESIGGFWDATISDNSNPWFIGMDNYLANSPGDSEYNYLLKAMRAHAEDDHTSPYKDNIKVRTTISCAPSAKACEDLGGNQVCKDDCYNRNTKIKVQQGYYEDKASSADLNLYADKECGSNSGSEDFVSSNEISNVKYLVYESSTYIEDNHQTCDRVHETPVASNAIVLPKDPNAGQELICNYTYTDPEDFTEQNSVYEWWKNGVNQNINSQILDKDSINPGENWFCKITPSDGLLFGNKIQSSNIVTVSNAVQNPTFSINNNQIWNENGHFGETIFVNGFDEQLESALNNCIPDTEGFCDISLTFSSDAQGEVKLSGLDIIYSNENSSNVENLDSSPNVTLDSPQNNFVSDSQNLDLTCSASDDINLANISLYNNLSGNWELAQTQLSSSKEDSKTFTLSNIPDNAHFTWNCMAKDNANQESFGLNRSINIKLPVESSAIDVKNLNVLESDFDLQTFEFTIHNNGENTINDLNWQFDTGDNSIPTNSLNINLLNPDEEIIIILQHEYSNLGIYNIKAAANGNSNQITDSETKSITVGDLEIISFTKLSTDGTKALFELQARNYLSQAINGISWSLDTRNQVINSNSQFNLNPNEIAFIYVEHDYLINGNFNAAFKIYNGIYEDYKVLEVNI